MEIGRNILLWGSTNDWMKKNVPNFKFVKRAVKRFMPGETASEALAATDKFVYYYENLLEKSITPEITKELDEKMYNITMLEMKKADYIGGMPDFLVGLGSSLHRAGWHRFQAPG